jgi:hypothetical protein
MFDKLLFILELERLARGVQPRGVELKALTCDKKTTFLFRRPSLTEYRIGCESDLPSITFPLKDVANNPISEVNVNLKRF